MTQSADNLGMRAFVRLFGDWLAHPPGDAVDRLTSWVLALLGGLVVGLMLYAYVSALGR
jgi:hypothetical protein